MTRFKSLVFLFENYTFFSHFHILLRIYNKGGFKKCIMKMKKNG